MRLSAMHTVRSVAVVLLVLSATTAGLLIVRDHLDPLSVALIYLISVTAIALRGETRSAAVGSIVAFLCLNFFFITPYYTFKVAEQHNILELFVFLGLSLLVSHLVVRDRQRTAEALRHARESATLYHLSTALVGSSGMDDLLDTVVDRLVGAMGIDGCSILMEQDSVLAARATPDATVTPLGEGLMRRAERARLGAEPIETASGNSDRVLLVPIRSIQRPLGVLAITRHAGRPGFGADETRLFATFANQVAVAIERNALRQERTSAEILRRSDELKTVLLSAVSHELRTPLAAIKASATSLLQPGVTWSSSDQRELLEGIDLEVDRLNRIVANLLDLSRIQSGALHPELSWNDPAEVIYTAVERVGSQLNDHVITINVADDLPLARLDFVEIEQVLVNLLENAARYAPAGTRITVTARRTGDTVEVSVMDEGPGVPRGDEQRIFETFYRVASPGNPPGSGVGLAVCRGLVEAHGGRIRAEPAPGGGLIVRFTLPLDAGAMPGVAASERAGS